MKDSSSKVLESPITHQVTFENLRQVWESFKYTNQIETVIGFSGGADLSNGLLTDEDFIEESEGVSANARALDLKLRLESIIEKKLKSIIKEILGQFRGYGVAVLTGGTNSGIPRIALEVAKECGLKAVAVLPYCGIKRAIKDDLVDLRLIVSNGLDSSHWSDEAAVWTNLVDAVVMMGGGAGTLVEGAHLLKMNEKIIDKYHKGIGKKPPKYIVPIFGTGGIAERLPLVCSNYKVREAVFPKERHRTGEEAGKWLMAHLDPEYIAI